MTGRRRINTSPESWTFANWLTALVGEGFFFVLSAVVNGKDGSKVTSLVGIAVGRLDIIDVGTDGAVAIAVFVPLIDEHATINKPQKKMTPIVKNFFANKQLFVE